MKSLPNIEPSGFRRGEYVGYREGRVYRIRRNMRGSLWGAVETAGGVTVAGAWPIFAATLEAMSAKLAGPESGLHH